MIFLNSLCHRSRKDEEILDWISLRRSSIQCKIFQKSLEELTDWSIKDQKIDENHYNFSYFPIITEREDLIIEILSRLEEIGVVARRYFYPSVNEFLIYETHQKCPISEDISRRILCLPSHDRVTYEDVDRIADVIFEVLKKC